MSDSLISAFADGELNGQEKAAAENLVSSDPNAKFQLQEIAALKNTLQSKLPSHHCEQTLCLCKERIAELERNKKTEFFVGRYGYAVAAILMVAILSAAYLNRVSGGAMFDKASLAKTLSASPVASSAKADEAEVWLRNVLQRESALQPGVLSLRRVDNLKVDGRNIGRLVYTDGATDYILVISPDTRECEGDAIPNHPGLKQSKLGELNVVTWCDTDTTYAFAAKRPIEELVQYIH